MNNQAILGDRWFLLLIKGISLVLLGAIAVANIQATAVMLLL